MYVKTKPFDTTTAYQGLGAVYGPVAPCCGAGDDPAAVGCNPNCQEAAQMDVLQQILASVQGGAAPQPAAPAPMSPGSSSLSDWFNRNSTVVTIAGLALLSVFAIKAISK